MLVTSKSSKSWMLKETWTSSIYHSESIAQFSYPNLLCALPWIPFAPLLLKEVPGEFSTLSYYGNPKCPGWWFYHCISWRPDELPVLFWLKIVYPKMMTTHGKKWHKEDSRRITCVDLPMMTPYVTSGWLWQRGIKTLN